MNTQSLHPKEKAVDETEYLSASPAMKEHLDKALEQEKNGEGITIDLDDIWNSDKTILC